MGRKDSNQINKQNQVETTETNNVSQLRNYSMRRLLLKERIRSQKGANSFL